MNRKISSLTSIISVTVITTISIIYSIPDSSLEIDNLDETYKVGESITFLIKQQGCYVPCGGYKVEVFDEDNTLVWSTIAVIDGQIPFHIPKMFQSFKDIVTIREYESVTDKPGTYTVRYTHKDLEVTQDFTVIPRQ